MSCNCPVCRKIASYEELEEAEELALQDELQKQHSEKIFAIKLDESAEVQRHIEELLGGTSTEQDNYASLRAVLEMAYEQAAHGKGAERHGNGLAFDEQPMQTISNLLGSSDGMAYQAIKKIVEHKRLPTKEARIRELLGAIVYISGIVIREQNQTED